jgi:hypothetical protein
VRKNPFLTDRRLDHLRRCQTARAKEDGSSGIIRRASTSIPMYENEWSRTHPPKGTSADKYFKVLEKPLQGFLPKNPCHSKIIEH